MSETTYSGTAAVVRDRLQDLDELLLGLAWESMSDDELVAVALHVERHVRRVAAVQNAAVAHVVARGIAGERGFTGATALLSTVLRLSGREAAARVRAAAELGPRRAITGEPLEPVFSLAAAAQADGELSAAQARVITKTITTLPPAVRAQHAETVETELVERARQFDAAALSKLAPTITAALDPDGIEPSETEQQRERFLDVHVHPDGVADVHARLTPQCADALLTMLDVTAAPVTIDGMRDQRSTGERRHDGLLTGIQGAIRAGTLPNANGVTTTMTVTVGYDQLAAYQDAVRAGKPKREQVAAGGLVTTGHGIPMSLATAIDLSGGDTEIIPLLTKNDRPIAVLDGPHRLATALQRRILAQRDHGCSFPGCTIAAAWCQTHHITDYQTTRHTHVDDLTLLCRHHHRNFEALGWTCRTIDHRPHWTAPAWLDPDQTPHLNTAHVPTPAR